MYADEITPAMEKVIKETQRRRKAQLVYNSEHDITPATIEKAVRDLIESAVTQREEEEMMEADTLMSQKEAAQIIEDLELEMMESAKNLEFEKAAAIRDQIAELKEATSLQIG